MVTPADRPWGKSYAPGVPLDQEVRAAMRGQAVAAYEADFGSARVQFLEQGASLLETLLRALDKGLRLVEC